MIREYVVQVTDSFVPDAFQRFENEWSPEQEIVRCRDCKHSKRMCQPWNDLICKKHGGANTPDWFCADGERKEGEA